MASKGCVLHFLRTGSNIGFNVKVTKMGSATEEYCIVLQYCCVYWHNMHEFTKSINHQSRIILFMHVSCGVKHKWSC